MRGGIACNLIRIARKALQIRGRIRFKLPSFQTYMTVLKNNIENCVYLQSKEKGDSLKKECYYFFILFCKNLVGETYLFAIGCVS